MFMNTYQDLKTDPLQIEKQKVGKRLEIISEKLNFQYHNEFAQFLGLKKGTLSSIMRGRNALSFSTLMKLAQRQINFNFLFYGVKTRHGGIIIPAASITNAEINESEGIYIDRIKLLEQENRHLKQQIEQAERRIKDKEMIIEILQRK